MVMKKQTIGLIVGVFIVLVSVCFLYAVIELSVPESVPTSIPNSTDMELLLQFLAEDTTEFHTYYSNLVECYDNGHFTEDLCRNATVWFQNHNSSIRLYPMEIWGEKGNRHMFVTTVIDGERVYIEPSGDVFFTREELKRPLPNLQYEYKYYAIGTNVRHIDCLQGSEVVGVFESGML